MKNRTKKKTLVFIIGLCFVCLLAPQTIQAAHTAYVEYYYEAGFYKQGIKVVYYKDNIRNKYITYNKTATYTTTKKTIYSYVDGNRIAYTLHWKTS